MGLISGPTISGTALTISSDQLVSFGYTLIYNKPYSWPTTTAEIVTIGKQCNLTSVICVATADLSGTLLLAACGNCLAITTTTDLNSPMFVDGIWWYFTPGILFDKLNLFKNYLNKKLLLKGVSFGFSPTMQIKQKDADLNSFLGQYRLSWHLMGSGGWRVGLLVKVYDEVHSKCIFIK